ncbi:hypothetical protein SDC9_114834 [bioreactor metagenome]|uniref:Uncharacterized protein n=1 Tax=bioreactor metagenome TaxID=1076179 RepID=A0A645BR60_9ZZZZ
MDIGEALERIRHFGLRLCIQKRLPGFGHQPLSQRQFRHRRLGGIHRRHGRNRRSDGRFRLGEQIT